MVASVSCNDVYSFTKPARDEITLIAGLGVEGDVHAGVTVKHRSRVAADPTHPTCARCTSSTPSCTTRCAPEGYEVPAGGLGENVTTNGLDLLALPRGTILRFGRPPTASDAARTEHAARTGAAAPACRGGPRGAAAARRAAAPSTPRPRQGQRPPEELRPSSRPQPRPPSTTPPPSPWPHLQPGSSPGDPATRTPAAHHRPAVVITGLRNPCQQINGYRSGLLKRVLGRDHRRHPARKVGHHGRCPSRWSCPARSDPIDVELPAPPYLPLDRV